MCRKHGEYESKVLAISPITGNEISTMCPECAKEKDAKARAFDEKQMRARISTRIENIGIPLRFVKKGLSELDAKTANQKNAIRGVSLYLEALKDGSSASLILCGKPGTGKTHIACAIATEIARLDRSVRYETTMQLMRAIKGTWKNDAAKTEEDVIGKYGSVSLLVIDEIGVQFGSDTERNIFHEVIDRRYGNMLPTILISNLPADELKGFIGERAFDRCREDGGAILAFDWESYRK